LPLGESIQAVEPTRDRLKHLEVFPLLCSITDRRRRVDTTVFAHDVPAERCSYNSFHLRDKIRIDPDAGRHALRHTFLTKVGEYTDAFTLQYIAGHDTIKTTMRHVHPRAESVSQAFGRINRKKKPAPSG